MRVLLSVTDAPPFGFAMGSLFAPSSLPLTGALAKMAAYAPTVDDIGATLKVEMANAAGTLSALLVGALFLFICPSGHSCVYLCK